jgi:hypothetical protein
MDLKNIEKEFKRLTTYEKYVISHYMNEINRRFDFNDNPDVIERYFKLIDMLFTQLTQTPNAIEKMSILDFMTYEIIFKTGVLVGLVQEAPIKTNIDDIMSLIGRN